MVKGQRGNPRRLKIVLVGRVAARALELLKKHTEASSTFMPFSVNRENARLLNALVDADVVVGHFFSEKMARAGQNLKLLQAPNAGVDAFRTDLLSPHTSVANAYFHGPAVAEYVVMMILALSRDLLNLDAVFRKGVWGASWTQGEVPGEEVMGKALGLVGYGHIGREVATRTRALGISIRVVSAHPPKRKPAGVDFWKSPAELRHSFSRNPITLFWHAR